MILKAGNKLKRYAQKDSLLALYKYIYFIHRLDDLLQQYQFNKRLKNLKSRFENITLKTLNVWFDEIKESYQQWLETHNKFYIEPATPVLYALLVYYPTTRFDVSRAVDVGELLSDSYDDGLYKHYIRILEDLDFSDKYSLAEFYKKYDMFFNDFSRSLSILNWTSTLLYGQERIIDGFLRYILQSENVLDDFKSAIIDSFCDFTIENEDELYKVINTYHKDIAEASHSHYVKVYFPDVIKTASVIVSTYNLIRNFLAGGDPLGLKVAVKSEIDYYIVYFHYFLSREHTTGSMGDFIVDFETYEYVRENLNPNARHVEDILSELSNNPKLTEMWEKELQELVGQLD